MEHFTLVKNIETNICKIEPISLTGCYGYRCNTGAQFTHKCRSDLSTTLAEVKCSSSLFSTICDQNSKESKINLNFDVEKVNKKCIVKCARGISEFQLKGKLIYLKNSLQKIDAKGTQNIEKNEVTFPWVKDILNGF